jgi:hypothetical protein
MNSLEEQGEKIINAFFDVLLSGVEEYLLPNLDKIPISPVYRMFLTQKNAHFFIDMAKRSTANLPKDMKMMLAIRVKKALEETEDMYVRDVLRGKQDASSGLFLESLGELKWNGI